MALLRTVDRALDQPWAMIVTGPGACAGPGDLDALTGFIPAPVPGTAAGALRAAGRWSDAAPTPLHGSDVWYRTRIEGRGREILRFEGLATLCEVWLDGRRVLASRSMFLAHEVAVDLDGTHDLALAFRSLAQDLARPHTRGRWRPQLATPGSLRHARTTLLGFMPGWCPGVDAVGPYRPITRRGEGGRPTAIDLRASVADGTGILTARLTFPDAPGPLTLRCDGRETVLAETAPGLFEGRLDLPGVALWWPHTHGEPRLHAVALEAGDETFDLGRVGFRTITMLRTFAEGLSLAVNGVPVFCRGACWTPADLVGLAGDRAAYAPLLALAVEAGMNMLRVGGTMLYEAQPFHDLCDELGILVWQDLMLANFDYPVDDPAFRTALAAEIAQLLDRHQSSPSLCILGGGSEVEQQAAMLGFPEPVWRAAAVEAMLREAAGARRPDLVVVPNSPSGGDLPFSTDAGVTHYYGVGAYCRPFEDARRAEVRFASECLAFANVPEPASLRESGLTDPRDPAWAGGVPRDRGADWDFEGVRDHYVGVLYGVDPERLRRDDPERYLTLGRAAVAEVMETTFAEWRRTGSVTAGGLVWLWRDLAPGAGWGVIDVAGRPKSAWYALKRAFRPVQAVLSDEGLNGLHAHLRNETARPLDATLSLTFTNTAGKVAAKAERAVSLGPREAVTLSSAALLGRFFDATAAYRFGPAAHALAHLRLTDRDGALLAESFHFPAGRDATPRETGLSAALAEGRDGVVLRVAAERHALAVHVTLDGEGRPSDNWFHLAPGGERSLALTGTGGRPSGTVRAVNGSETVRF
ncbi:glycosyl hydrolase 2 galactose-binding domain-containing protein [Methylobacterium nonmethylotrophicum]|uniref:Glycoside hydrolase family 2 protein n=1 Tax=Methylobacterium nonmethylotrophicum TaxID=1141884 RepID=A0A4Z0NUH1_9HYPH|nr:glycoside hydrolase family 2 protein [Methylobacterium nonmethylotrophicum]TGE00797.1 glycoside hydrolase family 2 protein [Methylobacterium nonmethylotrophicum]